jgi:hypothetical protein
MMPPLPKAGIRALAPFAPLFSGRVWGPAQGILFGAILTPGPRTVTAAWRVMGLAMARHFTNFHRVLNRAAWSARQGSRMLRGLLLSVFVPPEAPIVLGADDTVERRSGRKIRATGGYRAAVRSSQKHITRCFGLKWVLPMLLVLVPWSRRVWALPFLTALCWPTAQGKRRRHKTRIAWVRQMMPQARRWLPGRRLVLGVGGGFAAVSLALACVKHRVAMVSRLRWDAALYHPPAPHRQANVGANRPRGNANGACRTGQSARLCRGRPWRSTGTEARANRCESSRAPRCGLSQVCPPWPAATCWWRTREASSAWPGASLMHRRAGYIRD